MNKALIIIAGAALGLCLLFFAIAAATGSLGLFNGSYQFADFTGDKPVATSADSREWIWTGDSFKGEVPATVHYAPDAKGRARIIVRGSADELDKIAFYKGELAFTHREWIHDPGTVDVTISGAVVRNFSIAGMTHLLLGAVHQNTLDVNVAGKATINAEAPGYVDNLTLNIAGRSDDHLGKLIAQSAHIHIAGQCVVEIAPIDDADIDIMGHGDIALLTKPKHLNTHVMGSINITDAAGNTVHDR